MTTSVMTSSWHAFDSWVILPFWYSSHSLVSQSLQLWNCWSVLLQESQWICYSPSKLISNENHERKLLWILIFWEHCVGDLLAKRRMESNCAHPCYSSIGTFTTPLHTKSNVENGANSFQTSINFLVYILWKCKVLNFLLKRQVANYLFL